MIVFEEAAPISKAAWDNLSEFKPWKKTIMTPADQAEIRATEKEICRLKDWLRDHPEQSGPVSKKIVKATEKIMRMKNGNGAKP